jgi:hypothetical protein
MKYWILKGKRKGERFENDFERMLRRGRIDRWYSAKLLDTIDADDRLFVYEGSPAFQVWGLARYVKRLDDETFRVEYLTEPLTERVQRDKDGIATEPIFQGASFLKAGPVQTIYLLDEEQGRWLYRAVTQKAPEALGTWPDLERAPTPAGGASRHTTAKPTEVSSEIVRAISIRQPYVELILRGTKREEYRSRPTRIRERVWLYAGLNPGDRESWDELGMAPGSLPTGQIVGTVEITDCTDRGDDFAYALRDPRRLETPLRPTNQPQPGFWRPQF